MEALQKINKQLTGYIAIVEELRPIHGFEVSVDRNDLSSGKQVMEVFGTPMGLRSAYIESALECLRLAIGFTNRTYKEITNKELETVSPNVDNWKTATGWEGLNYEARLKILIGKLEEILKSIADVFIMDGSREANILRTNIYSFASSAAIHLKYELKRFLVQDDK